MWILIIIIAALCLLFLLTDVQSVYAENRKRHGVVVSLLLAIVFNLIQLF